jgi:hypothetical protein
MAEAPSMISRRLLAILACSAVLSLAPSVARADTEHEGTFWTGYMSSWWLDPSWALWFDTHYNLDTFFLLRGGITHAFEAGPTVTTGYAWLLLNPEFEREEHRPWAQVFVPIPLNDDWSLSGRFRMDFRFLDSVENGEVTNGTDFAFRTRFQTTLTRRFAPIRWGKPFAQLSHELLLNAASDPHRDVLDQNRVSLLFGLETKWVTIRTGYMNRYLPSARGGNGLDEHSFIVWFTQRINLREKKQQLKQKLKIDYDDYPEYGGP